ncbi:OmpA family protein [Oligoflexia bacterium]|nr:OmpA family protein [Oligoflexia bacterium]
MAEEKPIIIVKKKGGHGGHHGGAWKVAYADFVTAMMAFFMVMWLLNSAEVATKQNIASYFKRPGIFAEGSGTPLLIGEAGILRDAYVPPHDAEDRTGKGHSQEKQPGKSGTEYQDDLEGNVSPDKLVEKTGEEQEPQILEEGVEYTTQQLQKMAAERLAEDIRQQVESYPELEELLGIVDIKVEADGLNIEIMDTEKSSMFRSASARIEAEAQTAFGKLAGILKKVPNKIDIVGHTDAIPFSSRRGGYSNWELSADRANAARRILELNGIASERIISVVGRADREPQNVKNPFAASNRRITLKMRFDQQMKIDLSKNPKALDEVKEELSKEEMRVLDQKRKLGHRWAPETIIKATKRDKNTIPLPADSPPGASPTIIKKDKIFSDAPVFGPTNPFLE